MITGNPPSPGISKSKAKMSGELISSYAKKSHNTSFSVNIQKKLINGEPTVTYCLNNYDYDYSKGEPLKEEYTDAAKFAKAVHDYIIAVGDQL